jgi:anti-sigma regulatory factor (Ser/Thr protein kinase)
MPLGLLPGSTYEERETTLEPDEAVLLYSDGLVEAHDPAREMFGSPRLAELVGREPDGAALIDLLLQELDAFTGPGWEQEDDITLVALRRTADVPVAARANGRVLASFEVESVLGNERAVVAGVTRAVEPLGLPARRVERLGTAVAEAAMNAIEHGNGARPELPVTVAVVASDEELRVRIGDLGGGAEPVSPPEVPDLDAKLAGLQRPRGWGLYLIEHMVDAVDVSTDGERRTVELVVRLKGGEDG